MNRHISSQVNTWKRFLLWKLKYLQLDLKLDILTKMRHPKLDCSALAFRRVLLYKTTQITKNVEELFKILSSTNFQQMLYVSMKMLGLWRWLGFVWGCQMCEE